MRFGCGRSWACVEFGETSPYRLVGYWNHGRRIQLGPLVLQFGSPWFALNESNKVHAWGVAFFHKSFFYFVR